MLRKICNWISVLLLITLAALAVALYLPRIFGVQNLVVISGSMEPEIPVGSVVYAEKTDPAELVVGDIIAYELGSGTRVTHRIAEIHADEGYVITKGDANNTVDGAPVYISQIIGQVRYHIPYLGYLSIYIRTPLGIAAVCGVFIILILCVFLPEIFPREREKHAPL